MPPKVAQAKPARLLGPVVTRIPLALATQQQYLVHSLKLSSFDLQDTALPWVSSQLWSSFLGSSTPSSGPGFQQPAKHPFGQHMASGAWVPTSVPFTIQGVAPLPSQVHTPETQDACTQPFPLPQPTSLS